MTASPRAPRPSHSLGRGEMYYSCRLQHNFPPSILHKRGMRRIATPSIGREVWRRGGSNTGIVKSLLLNLSDVIFLNIAFTMFINVFIFLNFSDSYVNYFLRAYCSNGLNSCPPSVPAKGQNFLVI